MKTRQLGSVHWEIKGTGEDQTVRVGPLGDKGDR